MSSSSSDASARSRSRSRRVAIPAVITILVLIAVYYAIKAFVSLYTSALWFHSVHDGSVFTRQLLTKVVLFAIFGGITAAVVAVNLVAVVRWRPPFAPNPAKQRWRYLYQRDVHRFRHLLLVIVTAYFTVSMGSLAARSWQTWLQWRNAAPFGEHDAQFHRDISYFLFIYPMHRLVLTLLFRVVVITIVLVLIAAYLYGGVRLRGAGPRITRAVTVQLSVLVGAYFVLKAFAYWLDRFGLATSNRGVVTGPSYTDVHAVLPDKLILLVIAGLLALLLLGNVVLRRASVLAIGVGIMAAAALVFGVVVPALVQQFKDKPSASRLELPYINRNIAATHAAFGLQSNVDSLDYAPQPGTTPTGLRAQADANAQVRLLDPNRFSPTFTRKQQLRPFYAFKSTLDVDRYPVGGRQQDLLVAVRELQQSGLPSSQQTWTNTHLVYTHGYGMVAAPTGQVSGGAPLFVEKNAPPTGVLGHYAPQVYYGQMSPSYSIVGAPSGSQPREFDRPDTIGSGQVDNTYTGGGGISLGSEFRRLVYAVKYHSLGVLFSNEINRDSQLLAVRNPRSRVAAVAPWLTLDGDVYPVVSGGRILWVVDGYTTSNNYPYSQQQNLRGDTSSTLSQSGSTVTQPSTSINYMRNSVKATVDAYTGRVTLYEWGQTPNEDPVLATWEKAFPHLVQPQSAIPASLLPHLRYPQDLFNVQRTILTKYHVTNPSQFYNGADFWKVPTDPAVKATTTTNSIGNRVSVTPPSLPSAYLSISPDGTSPAVFSLTTPLVSLNRVNLAALLTVDSQPGPDYGRFTLLNLPLSGAVQGLSQIQNNIESTPRITQKFTLLRGGNSRLVLGNLLTIPLGGQVLYVEPVYTQSTGPNSFPIFRKVIAIYGNGPPSYSSTLRGALDHAIGVTPTTSSTTHP